MGQASLEPSLEEPQLIDVDDLHPGALQLLANTEVRFLGDAQSDLRDLEWPWSGARYARSIRIELTTYHGDPLIALVNRYYPGYQETILGSEGLIISKRLAAPFRSPDDRSLLWTFECQAEADLLVRLNVDIDWGEPLTQRMVDGLLVAQLNPRAGQGIYRQSNAESTRIFGNPHGPPESVILDDAAGTAHLVYYVLVNGIVDISLLLTLSDVGEQVAWSSFLALRDTERAFEVSNKAWREALRTARIWTPDVRLNRLIDLGKLAALRHQVHLRSGMAPADRATVHVPPLVDSFDALDLTQSRNLLAHLRRVAERSSGVLPAHLSPTHKDPVPHPGRALAQTNGAYLRALLAHLERHFDESLLAAHYEAVRLCSEALISARRDWLREATAAELQQMAAALRAAQALSALQQASADSARWESEAREYARLAGAEGGGGTPGGAPPAWEQAAQWKPARGRPWRLDDPWAGIALAARAVWHGCGISMQQGEVCVSPTWPAAWRWWALLGLELPAGTLSLLWDGESLHSTLPLRSALPVQVHEVVRALKAGEDDFDLEFEYGAAAGPASAGAGLTAAAAGSRRRFRPVFQPA